MIVRIALFLVALWVALMLLNVLLKGFVHILIIAAVVFLLIKLVDRGPKKVL